MTTTSPTVSPLSDNLDDALLQFHPLERQALAALASQVSRVFVTGAGGFLGKAICQRLVAAGIAVTGFARGDYPQLRAMGVDMVSGDIADASAVKAAMTGCDLVFHVASKAGVWGSKASYYLPNVDGCRHIIDGCKAHNIASLVYTSTPSVTFAGEDEAGIDESAPYASHYLNYYGESKAIAEQMVVAANGNTLANEARLKTVSLRPHLIWGPEDPHLVPRVIERAKAKRLKLVGSEDKLVDTIYVGNAAYAHILAALSLLQENSLAAGKCYFLSNDQPITMAEMLNKILACASLPPVSKRVPSNLAYGVGALLEHVYRLLGKSNEPIMTRFVAKQLSTCHYFDISAAKQDLGYQPIVSIDEGMQALAHWLAAH
ncbi:2-alkyl-3-oxoalkanoate reductase [Shewanella colwelliana]|uniref:2-alkyl-3-oxoalkanoate reductase n=1 Tax=Shewanella colwelliana TaxID=23 RepID=UPI0037352942